MKPLLIGQAPGPNTLPDYPLFPAPKTSAGGRLQTMTGLSRGGYLKAFERVNIFYEYQGKSKKEDRFPVREARLIASSMRPLLAGRTVVLVGRNVASAFGHEEEFLEWKKVFCRRRSPAAPEQPFVANMACLPHPSGRNPWYNAEENREAARTFLKELTDRLPC